MTDLTPELRRDRDTRTAWLHPDADRRLRSDLKQLPELLALVDTHPEPQRVGEGGPRPMPGSRPPLSLHALTITDRRLRQDDSDVIGAADLDRMAGRRDGIEPTIRSWVMLAEGEMLDEGEPHADIPETQGIGADCAWLARHIVWITEQQWVTELAGAVRYMVRDCEQHLRIRPEYRPTCPKDGCKGKLHDEGSGYWRCSDCRETTRDQRMGLREVVAKQQPMTVRELASAFGLSVKTLEAWATKGELEPADPAVMPRTYHVADVLRLMDGSGRSAIEGAATLAEIADMLGLPVKTLHDWRRQGRIRPASARTVQRDMLFRTADVEEVARKLGRTG